AVSISKAINAQEAPVLADCQRYRSNVREIGELWGHLHDRYGQLVILYTKLLLYKISFHTKHPEFPPNLEVTDDVLEKAAGTDVNNIAFSVILKEKYGITGKKMNTHPSGCSMFPASSKATFTL
ncbi:hypothetical protein AB205_0166370, partial [Aquarana catesbeiana]